VVEFRIDGLDGEVACSATTGETIEPGGCLEVYCDWLETPIDEEHDLWVVVDPPAGEPGTMTECDETNNLTFAERVRCPPLLQ
jgi:hypothetical protein